MTPPLEHLPNDQTLEHLRETSKAEQRRLFIPRADFDELMKEYMMQRQRSIKITGERDDLSTVIDELIKRSR